MKSKKIFAILTLVAFLMTLVPMAAFALVTVPSAAASSLKATNTSVDVYNDNADNLSKFVITFKDSSRVALSSGVDVTFHIKTSNDGAIGTIGGVDIDDAADAGTSMGAAEGALFTNYPVDSEGKVTFYIGSNLTGSFTVKVGLDDASDFGNQIGDTITVKVGSGDGQVTMTAYEEDGDVTLLSLQAGLGADEDTPFVLTAGDGVELKAVLEDGNNPIEGKTVTFKKIFNDGSWAVLGTDVTDEDGECSFYYEATKAGDYQYKATSGDADASAVTYVTYGADDVDSITDDSEDGTKVAVDYENTITFLVKDKNGNDCQVGADTIDFSITSAPADSDLEDYEDNGVAIDDGEVDFKFTPDLVGKYTIKAKVVDSRLSKTITVDALEFGDVTKLTLELDNDNDDEIASVIAADEDNAGNYIAVKVVDENGVELDAADFAEKNDDFALKYASADNSLLTVSDTGVLATQDKDDRATVVITVIDTESGVMASIPVEIVGASNALKATAVATGKTAEVTLQYVDKDGKDTTGAVDEEEYDIIMPAGVNSADKATFDLTGEATFNLEAEAYGKYNVTVVTASSHISKTFTVDFVQPASEIPVIGAKSVTMFIGATGYVQDGVAKVSDVAPFISAGRTFVAVKPIADAFGATAAWNEATKTVTLTRSDMTITIVIGSNAITVVKGGVTSTVTADVAAYISNGRTVLPFRAVGDAFGANVSYDAATQAVSFTQGI